MDQTELTAWGQKNGWRDMTGGIYLAKPGKPKDAIVRLLFKGTVASLEVRRLAGKWEKVGSAKYADITLDPETDWPGALGFEKIPSFSMLMRENKDAQVFARFGKP